jgi:D-lactate dehydrogenase (cytochrome)
MSSILAVRKEDFDVVVQSGVSYLQLNETLSKYNMFLPPDPGAGALIGSMIGTGCSGTNSYRYGTIRDLVISLTVVLADGTVIKTRQRSRKSSAGYDHTKLFIGSEGTLGLVTGAVLKFTAKPETESVALASFSSIFKAAACVETVVAAGFQVTAMELIDETFMRLFNTAGATLRKLPESPTILFKFSGSPSAVREEITLVKELADKGECQAFEFAKDEEDAQNIWQARKKALHLGMGLRKNLGDLVWITEVTVPISQLATHITKTKEVIDGSGLVSELGGHAGDGSFHSGLMKSMRSYPLIKPHSFHCIQRRRKIISRGNY